VSPREAARRRAARRSVAGSPPRRAAPAAARRHWAQVARAMIGSVCGTLLTGALDTSPTVRLIGAVLGAAIPTLIGYAGPYYHLRASVGIAATAVALFLTYGGFTLFDFAADRPQTFPLPSAVPEPHEGSGPSGASVQRSEDGLGIRVTPAVLRCSSGGCEEPVRIREHRTKASTDFDDRVRGPCGLGFRSRRCMREPEPSQRRGVSFQRQLRSAGIRDAAGSPGDPSKLSRRSNRCSR
jgi:hypothetical protein